MTELGPRVIERRLRAYTTTDLAACIGSVTLMPGTLLEIPEHETGILTTPRPDGHVHEWPCRIFRLEIPPGTRSLQWTYQHHIVRRAFVEAEVDSSAALGPQAREILEMADQLKYSTQRERDMMAYFASKVQYDATMQVLRWYAEQEGRDNSKAIIEAMLVEDQIDEGAQRAANAAALAVAYRDILLTQEEIELYDLLYEPWRKVMVSPYF